MPPHVRVGTAPFRVSNEEQYMIEAMHSTGTAKPRDHMYGSTAAFCPRLNFAYAHQKQIDTETSASSALYMEIGNGIEKALATGLFNANKLLYSNLRLPPMVPYIGGKIDLVYVNAENEITIGEVKSCGDLPAEPKYSYMRQLLTYLAIGGYRTGHLLFVSRNVVNKARKVAIRSFEADVSDASLLEVLKQICYTERCIKLGLLPPIPAQFKKSVHCKWCNYKDSCWGDGIELEPYPALGDQRLEVEAFALAQAQGLLATRDARYVTSLRFIYRNLPMNKKILRNRVIAEIEKFEPFGPDSSTFIESKLILSSLS